MIQPSKQLFLKLACVVLMFINCKTGVIAQPSKEVDIYFVPFSHLDLFWGGTREECLSRGSRIISRAIQLANESPKWIRMSDHKK
jgi:hypothetical protein